MTRDRGWHSRGYLPHFDGTQVTQFLTIRLADSPPKHLRKNKHDVGSCNLGIPAFAAIVQESILLFNEVRYQLFAWVVMPNHVHILMELLDGFSTSRVIHTLKSFTAHRINSLQGSSGPFWQRDYFDRYIRDARHFDETRWYIEENPVRASLVSRKEDWKFSSAYREVLK